MPTPQVITVCYTDTSGNNWLNSVSADLQKENTDLLEADPGKCEELTSVWASRRSLPEVRTDMTCGYDGYGYDPQKDQINTLDRRTQTTIFRLRTSHCGLRKRLKRLGLADSAHCECGSEEQIPEHILQTCPHLETARQQFWPEDAEVSTKLWGQAAELQRTADFLAATGLRI